MFKTVSFILLLALSAGLSPELRSASALGIQSAAGLGSLRAPRLWEQSTASSFSQRPARIDTDGRGGVFLSFGPLDWMDGQQLGAPIKLRELDGTIDPTFKPGIQGLSVNATATTPDGKVLVAQGRDNCETVERLLPTGERDLTFTPIAFSSSIRYLTVATNGDILVTIWGNSYSSPNPKAVLTPETTLVRLKPNGLLDTSFKAPALGGGLPMLAAQPVIDTQGRIYIAGQFVIGTTDKRVNIARLLPNGALDPTFLGSASLTAPLTGTIRGIGFQTDGKVIAVGDIRLPERVAAIRFDANGRRDPGFTSVLRTAIGASDYPRMLVVQADDKIVCAAGGLIRLNAGGTVDTTFKRFVTPSGFVPWVTSLSKGRLVVPADDGLDAFLADGTPDPSFKAHSFGLTQIPTSMAVLPSERIVLAGGFNRLDGQAQTALAILDPAGLPIIEQPNLAALYPGFTENTFYDASFTPPLVAEAGNSGVYLSATLRDTNYEPVFQSVARLTGGKLDATFKPSSPDVASADQIVSAPDGGAWVVHNGGQAALARNWLLRLLPGGQRSPTFAGLPTALQGELGEVTFLADRSVSLIRVGKFRILRALPDGGVLACVNAINGTVRLVRLDVAGQLVADFQSPQIVNRAGTDTFSNINDPVVGPTQVQLISFEELVFTAAAVLSDGRLAVCGGFGELSGKPMPGLALLQANGRLDATFTPPVATYDGHPFMQVRMLSVEADSRGGFFLAGLFDRLGGEPAPGLVRLHSTGAWDRSFVSPVELTDYPVASAQLRVQGDQLLALGTFRDPTELFPRPLWKLPLGSNEFSVSARTASSGRVILGVSLISGKPLATGDVASFGFEVSTDLKVWKPVTSSLTVQNGALEIESSPGAGDGARFYRAIRK